MTPPHAPRGGLLDAPAAVAGAAVAAAVGGLTALRRTKPMHPDGGVFTATVHRTGSRRTTGVPWIDEAGTDEALVRVSRAIGLSPTLPDIYGIALRWEHDGSPVDVLLAGTGLGRIGRFTLRARPRFSGPHSTLMPYRGPTGQLLLAAVVPPGREVPIEPAALAAALTQEPLLLRLAHASLTGPWWPFGWLEVAGPARLELDPPLRFDPVLHPVPGLRTDRWAASAREPAYRTARTVAPS